MEQAEEPPPTPVGVCQLINTESRLCVHSVIVCALQQEKIRAEFDQNKSLVRLDVALLRFAAPSTGWLAVPQAHLSALLCCRMIPSR